MSKRKTPYFVLITIACAIGLSGCLTEEIRMAVKYDAKSDTFAVFTLYEHFRSTGNDVHPVSQRDPQTPQPPEKPLTPAEHARSDSSSLEQLWNSRDRLIPVAPINIFDGPLKITLSPDRLKPENADWPPDAPPISWQKIEILPGKLFEDRNGMIGYSHELHIPGTVVDELLRFAATRVAHDDYLKNLIQTEFQTRKSGKKIADWPELSSWLKARLEAMDKPKGTFNTDAEDPWRQTLSCMDDHSLEVLRDAIDKKSLDLTRTGPTLHLHLPITTRDAQGFAAAIHQINTSLNELEKNKSELVEENKAMFVLRTTFAKSANLTTDKTGLTIEINMVTLLNDLFTAAHEEQSNRFATDELAKTHAKAMTKEVETWQGTSLQRNIDPQKLLTEFTSRAIEKRQIPFDPN